MRHGDKVNNLGRTAAHRHALMRNLASALIEHKRIVTTLAKAKALRQYIEPLVTKAKDDSTANRRLVFSYLQNKESIKKLFGSVRAKVGDRPGGYVRVIKTGFRRSDGAEMAMIEFVDFNEVYQAGKDTGKAAGKRRGRRGGKSAKPAETAAPAVVTAPVAQEPVVAEEPPVVEDIAEVDQEETPEKTEE